MSFLSLDAAAMRGAMPAAMRQTLELQRVEIGGSLASLEHHHAGILSTVTGVFRSEDAARALLDGRYCVTGDAVREMVDEPRLCRG